MRVHWCVSSWFRIKNTHSHTHTRGVPSSHPSLGLSVFFLSFLALTQVEKNLAGSRSWSPSPDQSGGDDTSGGTRARRRTAPRPARVSAATTAAAAARRCFAWLSAGVSTAAAATALPDRGRCFAGPRCSVAAHGPASKDAGGVLGRARCSVGRHHRLLCRQRKCRWRRWLGPVGAAQRAVRHKPVAGGAPRAEPGGGRRCAVANRERLLYRHVRAAPRRRGDRRDGGGWHRVARTDAAAPHVACAARRRLAGVRHQGGEQGPRLWWRGGHPRPAAADARPHQQRGRRQDG